MDAPLTPKIEQLINERLQSGSYRNATEVIEDALQALSEREAFQAIRADLDHAEQQVARGEYSEYDKDTIHELAEGTKTRGLARLNQERNSGNR